jgi:hypothetical protein
MRSPGFLGSAGLDPAIPCGANAGTHTPRSSQVVTDTGAFRLRRSARALSALALMLMLFACTHRVQVEAPKEPIVINLNVKIEQEVRVKVEKDVEDLLAENPELF